MLSQGWALPHVAVVAWHPHPANQFLHVAVPVSMLKVPPQLLLSHDPGLPQVLLVAWHWHVLNQFLHDALPVSMSKVPPQLLPSHDWGFPHVLLVGVHWHVWYQFLHVARPVFMSKLPAQLFASQDWGFPHVLLVGAQGQPGWLLLQVALPVLLSKVPAQLSASHDCVLGGQVGVGVADDEVVDNEFDVMVVLSEVDNVVEKVVLDGMATMTEEGQTKYRIAPGAGYTAGHSSTPRLSRKAAPSSIEVVLLHEHQHEEVSKANPTGMTYSLAGERRMGSVTDSATSQTAATARRRPRVVLIAVG